MKEYKKEFIKFLLETKALKFGDFTLKSGRKSPFFLNIGSFTSGRELKELSQYYARAIHENIGLDFDIIFGPAYKGIPLAAATAVAIFDLYGKEVKFSSNRKEVKDHGDVGIFLGEKIEGKSRVVIIEDVTTSGKSIDETFPIITRDKDVTVKGMLVSVDRREYGKVRDKTALDSIREDYGIETFSIVNIEEIIAYLKGPDYDGDYVLDKEISDKLEAYFLEYGVK